MQHEIRKKEYLFWIWSFVVDLFLKVFFFFNKWKKNGHRRDRKIGQEKYMPNKMKTKLKTATIAKLHGIQQTIWENLKTIITIERNSHATHWHFAKMTNYNWSDWRMVRQYNIWFVFVLCSPGLKLQQYCNRFVVAVLNRMNIFLFVLNWSWTCNALKRKWLAF